MRSIESNQVETQCRLARCSNHMDSQDDPFASSEKAIMRHTNSTSYGIYVLLQDILTFAHKAGSWASACNGSCSTTCFAVMYYEFLAHSAYIAGPGDERYTSQCSERR